MTYLKRVDADADHQEVTFLHSPTDSLLQEGSVVPWSTSLCKRALEQGPLHSADVAADYAGVAAAADLGLRSFIVEPVADADGKLVGTLCGASMQAQPLTDNDSATLRMYARLLEQKLRGGGTDIVVTRSLTSTLPAQRRRAVQLWEATREHLLLTSSDRAQLERRAAQIHVADGAWAGQRVRVEERAGHGGSRQRVVIADDQLLLREVLAAIIGGEPTMQLVGESDSAWSTVGVVAAEQPDILILDYDLGDAVASDVIEHIRTLSPATRVLLHSARSDVHQLGQQMRVDRVVHKGEDTNRLPEALRVLAI